MRDELEETLYVSRDNSFEGKLAQVQKKNFLLKDVVFTVGHYDCMTQRLTDHIWIRNAVLPENVKIGEAIIFDGEVYLYKRKDGSQDYGIKKFVYVGNAEPYITPTKEQIALEQEMQFVHDLQCETCLYTEQCDRWVCYLDKWQDRTFPYEVFIMLERLKNGEKLSDAELGHAEIRPEKAEALRKILLNPKGSEYEKDFLSCFTERLVLYFKRIGLF